MGGVGALGLRPCDSNHPRSSGGWREGCRPAWRAHCPAEREGGISSERDSEAASLGTRSLLCSMDRAAGWLGGVGGKRRGPQHRGSCEAGAGDGAALCTTALVSNAGSTPSCQPPNGAKLFLADSCDCLQLYPRSGRGFRAYRCVSPTASGCGTERSESSQHAGESAKVAGGCAVERSAAA